jgi:hypothetical protein
MSLLESVLRRHGYVLSEASFADHLDALLSSQLSDRTVIDISTGDAAFLAEYSGVQPASEDDLARLDARSVSRAAAEAARTMGRGDVARMLGVDPSRISHQVAAGRLYSYSGGSGRPVFPDWQFTTIRPAAAQQDAAPTVAVIPHLATVVAAFPAGSHPIAVRTFMTTPNQDLQLQGSALSPRDWLVDGGDPTVVAGLAATLGEQV